VLNQHAHFEQIAGEAGRQAVPLRPEKESQMPKIKTKSGAKKRFKITGTGKVLYAQRGKRHGMIKRTNKQIRQLRGTAVLFKSDGDNIKKYFLPNG
jgi:large subunit ribosomal protein L35